ncbi:MAG: helix-turn-helix domain-containing protein [Acetatifactor sp.]
MKKWRKELKKQWKRKTIRTWIIIFTAIFAVQIFSWGLVSQEVRRTLNIQTTEAYSNSLHVLSSSCDNDVNSVYSMLDVMALDESIRKRCNSTTLTAGKLALQNELVKKQLASYKVQHPFIDDIFIWFENTDKIISSNTVADSPLFYDIYGDVSMSYEQWLEALRQTYFKQDVLWENPSQSKILYILHSWSGADKEQITIAVKFKSSYLQDLADSFRNDNFAAIVIENKNGEPIVESTSLDAGTPKRSTSQTSDLTGWIYTAHISELGIKLYERVILIIFVLFLTVLLVTLTAFFLFWRTSVNPFMELTQYISSKDPEEIINGSEYMYIKDKFDEIVQKQKADELSFVNQMNLLKISYLIQILQGNLAVDESNRQLLGKMQLEYLYRPCAVLLIADGSDFPQQENCMGILEAWGIGMSRSSLLYGCSFFYEDSIVCLFELEGEDADMKKRVTAFVESIEQCQQETGIIAISSLKVGEGTIAQAYSQASYVVQSTQQLAVTGTLFFDEMQEKIKENVKFRKDDNLVVQVHKYIEQHYAEPDLTIELLCNELGKSVSYLSQVYKKRTGQNILYNLNLIRIEKAKELLREEDISIDEIGRRCGFTNSNSFIRVFKKYENVTPGRYKELHMAGMC